MSIQLRSRRGPIGTAWHAVALREAAERLLGAGRASRGRTDARAGRVQWLEVEPGAARAAVQDPDGELHQARLDLPAFRSGDHEEFLRAAAPSCPPGSRPGSIPPISRRSSRARRSRSCRATPPSSPTTAPAWTGPAPAATSPRSCTCWSRPWTSIPCTC
jgi:hypothetical protein